MAYLRGALQGDLYRELREPVDCLSLDRPRTRRSRPNIQSALRIRFRDLAHTPPVVSIRDDVATLGWIPNSGAGRLAYRRGTT
jgi:hypothetical protein